MTQGTKGLFFELSTADSTLASCENMSLLPVSSPTVRRHIHGNTKDNSAQDRVFQLPSLGGI
jgi:hypothetical protein